MTLTYKRFLYAGIIVFAALLGIFFSLSHSPKAQGASTTVPGITLHTINPPELTQDYYTFFTATTTSATSTTVVGPNGPGFLRIGGAKDVIFFFTRGDTKGTGNSGSSTFSVQVTPDGTNWFNYTELGQVQQSGGADAFYARTGTSTISAATSTLQYAMEDISYYGVRCIAARVTDGESSCSATANF